MSLADLAAPAAQAARDGVVVTEFQASLGRIIAPILEATPAARALFCGADGKPLAAGDIYRNPEFADVLEVFGHEGARFVAEGEVAAGLLALAEQGGHLTGDDLKSYRPEWRRPVEITRGRVRLAANLPPALGGVLVAFELELLGADLGAGVGAADLARAFEAKTRARIETGLRQDPEGGALRLLSPELIGRYPQRAAGAGGSDPRHHSYFGGRWRRAGGGADHLQRRGQWRRNRRHRHHAQQHAGRGRSDARRLDSWGPDTRLSSMMTPMAVTWPDGGVAMLGSGGSNRIRTALAQVLVNRIDRGMGLADAVAAPRLHVEASPPAVDFELPALAEADRAAILDAFPEARGWPNRSMFFGGVHAVTRDGRGNVQAAGDPRRSGVGIVG